MDTDPTSDDRRRDDADGASSAAEPARSVPAGSERARAHSTDAESPSRRDDRHDDARRDDRPAARDDRRVVRVDPALDEHERAGVSGATWVALILGAIILILLLIFVIQNNETAEFAYFGWQFTLPLGVAMLFAAIAGVLLTALLGSVRLFKLNRRVRRLEQERAAIKRAMG